MKKIDLNTIFQDAIEYDLDFFMDDCEEIIEQTYLLKIFYSVGFYEKKSNA